MSGIGAALAMPGTLSIVTALVLATSSKGLVERYGHRPVLGGGLAVAAVGVVYWRLPRIASAPDRVESLRVGDPVGDIDHVEGRGSAS